MQLCISGAYIICMKNDRRERAVEIFRRHAGALRTSQALACGIHPQVLYGLRDDGILQCISRGLYCLSDSDVLYHPDLAAAALRVPRGIICLTSALFFHDITSQIPHKVSLAIPRQMRRPVIDYPPMEFYRFSDASYEVGIRNHDIEGVGFNVYSPEKTVADCFKFRNRIGLDIAVEALRFCKDRKKSTAAGFLKYARLCRVQKVMAPYLEAIF